MFLFSFLLLFFELVIDPLFFFFFYLYRQEVIDFFCIFDGFPEITTFLLIRRLKLTCTLLLGGTQGPEMTPLPLLSVIVY